jgi:hypothetical protein
MSTQQFPIMYLNKVAQVSASDMTIMSGKTLIIQDQPTISTHATNKLYVDNLLNTNVTTINSALSDEVNARTAAIAAEELARSNAVNSLTSALNSETAARIEYVDLKAKQVQDALDLVTAGSSVNFDTLLELKNLADSVAASGASNLQESITLEATTRSAADAALTSALNDEVVARSNAIDAEALARSNAISEEASTRSSQDARLQMLAKKSSKTMLYVPAVYADSTLLPTSLELCNYPANVNAGNYDGWRMKNTVQGKKFNFYVQSDGLKVGDVKALYLETCTPSVVSMPFVTLYTKPKVGGAASWYATRATYIRNDTDTLVAGSVYNMVTNLKNVETFNSTYTTRHNTILDTYSSRGLNVLDDLDEVLFFGISSDSSSAAGNVECIISKFSVQLDSGVFEFVFSNAHVFADYMKQRQELLWKSLFAQTSTDNPFMDVSYVPQQHF